jgi:amino acid transporter
MSFSIPIILLLIALPIYFLIKAILKKYNIGSKDNRWLITFVTTLIISPIIYVIAITIWIFSLSYYPVNEFNKEDWTLNKEERFKMSKDIIENKILIGKTKSEIIELLGEDYYEYSDEHIAYELGFVPGPVNIDSDVLDIYFENGNVVKVEQHNT